MPTTVEVSINTTDARCDMCMSDLQQTAWENGQNLEQKDFDDLPPAEYLTRSTLKANSCARCLGEVMRFHFDEDWSPRPRPYPTTPI